MEESETLKRLSAPGEKGMHCMKSTGMCTYTQRARKHLHRKSSANRDVNLSQPRDNNGTIMRMFVSTEFFWLTSCFCRPLH